MPAASANELRWLLGKIIHCAKTAVSREEFESWMDNVDLPPEILEATEDVREDKIHQVAHAAYLAACWLHGHDSDREARAHAEITHAFERLALLPEKTDDLAVEAASPTKAAIDADEPSDQNTEQPAIADGRTEGHQTVDVARDVNAPIINAPGGSVYVNDQSYNYDRLLHDYQTFLIYTSFGVKGSRLSL